MVPGGAEIGLYLQRSPRYGAVVVALEAQQSGAGEVPLADVSTKIRELLTEQRVSELLVSWLHTLRSESDVRFPAAGGSSDGGEQRR